MEPDVHKEVNMRMEGDGPQDQPAEGVATLSDLTALLDGGEDGGEDAPGLSEDGDDSDDPEGEDVEQPEGEDDQDEQEEATVVLKHDGKDVPLKQSEVVELAQKGFDYTQKTMALADERKAVEEQYAQATDARNRHDQSLSDSIARLQAIESFMAGTVGGPPPVDLAQRDVALYIAQKEQYEARKGQLAEAQQAVQRLQDEQARTRQAWANQKGAETEKALKNTLPGWNENTLQELIAYAGEHGVGESNFDHVLLEKGFWELAHKAKAYDALLEKKAQMKPVSSLPKVAPAKAQNQPSQLARKQAAEKRYRESPSIGSLADLL